MSEIILDPDGDLRLQLRDYCSDAFDDDISAVLAPAQEQLAVEDTAPVDTTTGDEPTAEKATLSLIVSSELLSAASPIFEIMLQSKFKEGLELARCKVDLAAEYSLIGAALVRIINDDGIHELKNLIDQLHFNHNVLGTSRASIQPHPSQMGLLTFCTKKTWRQRETAACVKYTGQ